MTTGLHMSSQTTLDGVPYDVLVEILHQCRAERASVKALSLCSWHLRDACLPVMFRALRIGVDEAVVVARLPERLLRYVRDLRIRLGSDSLDEAKGLVDMQSQLLSLLPKMALKSVVVESLRADFWPLFIKSVSQISSLQILEIKCCPGVAFGAFHWPLRRLVYKDDAILAREDHRLDDGAKVISTLLLQSSTTLEDLEMVCDAAALHAMQRCKFGRLRRLVLRGRLPEQPPLISVLVLAPRLRVLRISPEPREDSIQVWPPVAPWLSLTEHWSPHSDVLSDLEELHISNPSPADSLFRHLPKSVKTLSLVTPPVISADAPRAATRSMTGVPTCQAVLSILQCCRLEYLTALHISVIGPIETSLLDCIAGSFRLLTEFEIHVHSGTACDYLPDGSVMTLAERLGPLMHLRVLRLNLPFREAMTLEEDSDNIYLDFLHRSASQVVPVLRSLKEVSFLWMSEAGAVWSPFRIDRDDPCVVVTALWKGGLNPRTFPCD